MSTPDLRLVSENGLPFDANRPIKLETGQYEFVLVSYWKGYLYGKVPKLILLFRIITEGPYFGYHLYRCYNLKGFTKRGEIIPKGWHSDFVREYSRLFGAPKKLRDIGVRQFKGKVIRGTVRTVVKDAKQRPLPVNLQYSVIHELLEVIAG